MDYKPNRGGTVRGPPVTVCPQSIRKALRFKNRGFKLKKQQEVTPEIHTSCFRGQSWFIMEQVKDYKTGEVKLAFLEPKQRLIPDFDPETRLRELSEEELDSTDCAQTANEIVSGKYKTVREQLLEMVAERKREPPKPRYVWDFVPRAEKAIRLDGIVYRPIEDTLVTTDTVLFPSYPEKYDSYSYLRKDVQAFIHKYVDISEDFERIAAYYVMLSWVYEVFSAVPYLRVLGDAGTGKSRFLTVMRALCYKSMRCSGAISVASIFRALEEFHGTLILDEADLPKGSDTTAALVKILNCGYEKDNPVIREMKVGDKFESVAYRVYGPKVLASRKRFDDYALEHRCLTERMTKMRRRDEIPLTLPECFHAEALALRNQLLMFRLTMLPEYLEEIQNVSAEDMVHAQDGIEPRISQIMFPLIGMAEYFEDRDWLEAKAKDITDTMKTERGVSVQGDVVKALFELMDSAAELSIKAVADKVNEQYENPQDRLSNRAVGKILDGLGIRKKLHDRSRRAVVDAETSKSTLDLLRKQYGVSPSAK